MQTKIIIAALLLNSTASAQQMLAANLDGGSAALRASAKPAHDEAPEVLARPKKGLLHHHGGYGAPTFGVTSMDGEFAPTFGLRGAWRINRQLGIGLAGTGLELRDFGARGDKLEAGYGGLLMEYIVGSNRLVHGMFDLTLGGGVLCESSRRRDCNDDPQGFFVAEPTANLELNVTSFMRIDAGAGYRLALTNKRDDVGSRELSGFVGRVGLAFGRF